MNNKDYGFEKGAICGRYGCTGIIQEKDDGTSCTCFQNAPCSHCVDSIERMYCPVCDWHGDEEEHGGSFDVNYKNEYKR